MNTIGNLKSWQSKAFTHRHYRDFYFGESPKQSKVLELASKVEVKSDVVVTLALIASVACDIILAGILWITLGF